ncbi:DUF6364 family protein [Aliifodinibius salipaludis]|nr:DUF6364 family protein [Aliifodinibius salipaludis]
MSKRTLNLSIEEEIKERAKKIAEKKGISVSQFFEELIAQEDDPDSFTPTPGSAAYELMNLIPESEKVSDYDYNKIKREVIEEHYDVDESTD